jgi:ankyrin
MTGRIPVLGACLLALLAARGRAAAADALPLTDAVKNVDRVAVERLIRQGVDVNAAGGDGATALHWASYRDDLAIADLLLRAGARVNVANDLGATALWIAGVNGSAPMVRRLLQAGANPNLALPSGETALMAAARSGSAEAVDLLAARGADANARATRGQTALMWAVAQKHPAVVKVLLEHGADLHARSDTWSQVMAVPPHGMLEYNRDVPHGSDTALVFAARVGDLESATLLVAAGAHVDDADAWGISATALAAHAGFRDVVTFLLDSGADPNVSGAGFTALHAAIMRRDGPMAAALLEHGADPNARVRNWTPTRRSSRDWNFAPELVGATPFWLAARVTHPGIMRLLLAHGANAAVVHHAEYHGGDPAEKRSQTTTALMAAAGMGGGGPWVPIARVEREALALESVKIAAETGIDLNAANDDGRTALDSARALKYESVEQFLVERGAKAGSQRQRAPAADR